MRAKLMLVWLLAVLAVVNWQIAKKEHTLRGGTLVLLKLAPVDPRSLIQGDYMALEYAVQREADAALGTVSPADGHLVLKPDSRGVAQFQRVYQPGAALQADERLLRYRYRKGRLRLGTDAFFFQEGHAEYYASAEYGALRVDAGGDSVLEGLYDKDLAPLRAPDASIAQVPR